MFNRKQDLVLAGGAGKNEVRVFDYSTGNIVCIVSDMERSILCMDIAKTSQAFAFGSSDSCIRIMDIIS
jgi:WD40 repeat protein